MYECPRRSRRNEHKDKIYTKHKLIKNRRMRQQPATELSLH